MDDPSDVQRRMKQGASLGEQANLYSKFVWATGGHSAAAGHGNFVNQSYTAYMERAARPVFASIGIWLEGRNYGMGGMKSAPELSLCNEAIFGTDADVISWDFGMTDGQGFWRKGLYTQRIGRHANRPALIDINADSGTFSKFYLSISSQAEGNGLTALYLDNKHWKEIQGILPEMMGMSEAEMNRVPPYIRHFKCQDQIEQNDPTCRTYRFQENICGNRRGRVMWHPGWKQNAIYGNLMAFFLVDSLLGAINQLRNQPNAHPKELLRRLLKEEVHDYERFATSKWGHTSTKNLDDSVRRFINPMFGHPVLCSTTLLPSQARYLGILRPGWNPTEAQTFDPGTPRRKADGYSTPDGPMLLTWAERDREKCEVPLNLDFKDYYYANDKMGWSRLLMPNQAEMQMYGRNGTITFERALLVVCHVLCDWGKCPQGEVNGHSYGKGLALKVNDVVVTNMVAFDDNCYLLKGDHGFEFSSNANGQFELLVQVSQTSNEFMTYTRITSVIAIQP